MNATLLSVGCGELFHSPSHGSVRLVALLRRPTMKNRQGVFTQPRQYLVMLMTTGSTSALCGALHKADEKKNDVDQVPISMGADGSVSVAVS